MNITQKVDLEYVKEFHHNKIEFKQGMLLNICKKISKIFQLVELKSLHLVYVIKVKTTKQNFQYYQILQLYLQLT